MTMPVLAPNVACGLPITITGTTTGLTLSSLQFSVYDSLDTLIQGPQAGTVTNASTLEALLNLTLGTQTLATGKTRDIRKVRLVATLSDSSTVESDFYYVLRGEALVVGENSFVTFSEAELIAFEMEPMDGYKGGSNEQKVASLMTARDDLCRLTYRYSPNDSQTRIVDAAERFSITLKDYDAAEFAAMPVDFQEAVKKAQVIQADYLLSGSTTEKQREDGLMSRTVGESSEMFRGGMGPVKYPVCKAAMAALSGYLEMNKWQIGRG